jgi:hypothetical protein
MVGFFIAMLEMIRRGQLTARQADNFSDIVLEPREAPPPDADRPFRRVRFRAAFPPAHHVGRVTTISRIGDAAFPAARPIGCPKRKRVRARILFVSNCRC